MKEIKQKCARPYDSDSKRVCRRDGEIFCVLGDDDFASANDRSSKHMPIFRVTGQTLFESQRNIHHRLREGVSKFLSQMIDLSIIPAYPPQISLQFRQNPIRPVRAIHLVPSSLKQDIPQERPEECAGV